MGKYWQTPLQMARSIFAHAETFNWARISVGAKLTGFSDSRKPVGFDLRRAPPQLDGGGSPIARHRLISCARAP
jgi:hypothetical protein